MELTDRKQQDATVNMYGKPMGMQIEENVRIH